MRRALGALVALLLAGGCATTGGMPPPPRADRCQTDGVIDAPNNQSPEVCVSVYRDPRAFGGLLVYPYAVHASRHGAIVLKWRTRDQNDNLDIRMKDAGCTETPRCNPGNGQCTAVLNPNRKGGEVCHYEAIVTFASGAKITLDPIVKIDTDGPEP
jgi:hypothetical protein